MIKESQQTKPFGAHSLLGKRSFQPPKLFQLLLSVLFQYSVIFYRGCVWNIACVSGIAGLPIRHSKCVPRGPQTEGNSKLTKPARLGSPSPCWGKSAAGKGKPFWSEKHAPPFPLCMLVASAWADILHTGTNMRWGCSIKNHLLPHLRH